jgi:hypothetical protein
MTTTHPHDDAFLAQFNVDDFLPKLPELISYGPWERQFVGLKKSEIHFVVKPNSQKMIISWHDHLLY